MLKIALFGGTGRVGQAFLNFVEEDGHHSVNALVRRTEGARIPDLCQAHIGNARNRHDVESLIKDCDIVVSCLNTDGDDTLTVSIEHIINAMNVHRIKRLITIGTAGILNARQNPAFTALKQTNQNGALRAQLKNMPVCTNGSANLIWIGRSSARRISPMGRH